MIVDAVVRPGQGPQGASWRYLRVMTTNRLDALRAAMDDAGAELVVVGPSSALTHLSGYRAMALERITTLLVTREDAVMIVPAFDAEEFQEETGLDALAWTDTDGPEDAVRAAFQRLEPRHGGTALVDPELPFGFYARLRPHLSGTVEPATALLGRLRQVKDDAEIARIARAGEVVSSAMDFALATAAPGMTERELRLAIEDHLRAEGADSAEYVLVQGGEASAIAHHEAGDRELREGEPVLVDIATPTGGYWADMTQQVVLGEPPADYERAYEAVLASEEAGVQACRTGSTAGDAARAAQAVIRDAGFGEWAGGRIGHGIGLDVHEAPGIIESDGTELVPGTVVTVEPGIYIPGRWGIRIEDTIVVTDGEPRRLTRAPRPLTRR